MDLESVFNGKLRARLLKADDAKDSATFLWP
jgi:hypothetical protein